MHIRNFGSGRSRKLLPLRAAAVLGLMLPLAACDIDELLEIDDAFTVTPETARDTLNLVNVYGGAVSYFGSGYGGRQNTEGGLVLQTGLLTDELVSTDNFGTRRDIDARQVLDSNAASQDPYYYLQRARATALNGADLYEASSLKGTPRHAELLNIAGYSTLMLAEAYCSGVPLSRVDNSGVFTFGEQLTREQTIDQAIQYFDQALALAGSDATQANLARVGKGRALLFRGDFNGAAAAVATVPTNFMYEVGFSASSQTTYNATYQLLNEELRWGVANSEGVNGLPFVTTNDPRVEAELTTDATGKAIPPQAGGQHFSQLKYEDYGADIPLASGIEARLIQAEAALQANAVDQALNQVNASRQQQGLGALTTLGANSTERVNTLFRERAYSLWLTAHRLPDLRRLVRQYNRPQETVFPIGPTRNGEERGTDVNFPIPFQELNNPNFKGCLDRNA